MMSKNHFDNQYNYYDSVWNSSSITSSDPRALFYNQEKKYKIEKYIRVLEFTFEELYVSKFEKAERNLFPLKNIPLDWIIWWWNDIKQMGTKISKLQEFMNYDHYIIDQQDQNDSNETILQKLISSRNFFLMMPKNHFENQYKYYDLV